MLLQILGMIYLKKKEKKKTKYDITFSTNVILFQKILNLYIMDQDRYHL